MAPQQGSTPRPQRAFHLRRDLRVSFAALVAALSLGLLMTGPAQAAPPPPIADPSVIRVGSTYYSVESADGHLYTRSASSPAALAGSERVRIWANNGLQEVWAPELVRIGGRYYVYFAAGAGAAHRMYVISSNSPTGGYGQPARMSLPDDKWAIDGTAFTFENQLWFVWSGWAGDTNIELNL